MRKKITITSAILLIAILAAGCSGVFAAEEAIVPVTGEEEKMEMETQDEDIDNEDMDKSHSEDMDAESSEMSEVSMDTPAWFGVPLTDVRSGEQYTINDFNGDVVLVETLAIWCSNCLKQQKEVKELHSLLGERDDFVSLGLDIDLNDTSEELLAYTNGYGFDWNYAVATPEVAREIGELYGTQFLNPPSTPMLSIDKTGQVHTLPFGIKRAAELMEQLEPFLGES